jgi:hypothetical protein
MDQGRPATKNEDMELLYAIGTSVASTIRGQKVNEGGIKCWAQVVITEDDELL